MWLGQVWVDFQSLRRAYWRCASSFRVAQELSRSSGAKYQGMARATTSAGRAHGLLQFYGANLTGRWAGRLIQVHNLPRNYLPDLAQARTLVRDGNLRRQTSKNIV